MGLQKPIHCRFMIHDDPCNAVYFQNNYVQTATLNRTPSSRISKSLVQSNRNVSPYPRSQVNLRLEVQLNTKQKCSILQLPIVVDRSLDDVAGWAVEVGRGGRKWGGGSAHGDFAAAGGLAIVAAAVRHVAARTSGSVAGTVSFMSF